MPGATIFLNACVAPIIYAPSKGYVVEGVVEIKRENRRMLRQCMWCILKNSVLRAFYLFQMLYVSCASSESASRIPRRVSFRYQRHLIS